MAGYGGFPPMGGLNPQNAPAMQEAGMPPPPGAMPQQGMPPQGGPPPGMMPPQQRPSPDEQAQRVNMYIKLLQMIGARGG